MPDVEALVLGLDPETAHRLEQLDDLVERIREHELEHEVLATTRVLGVVHRAHVERGHLRPAGLEVGDSLVHRDADGAGREVDDRRVADRAPDRIADRQEILDLVARRPVGLARVDVDVDTALVDDPARLGGVLLGRVRDRRALVAVGDRPGYRSR